MIDCWFKCSTILILLYIIIPSKNPLFAGCVCTIFLSMLLRTDEKQCALYSVQSCSVRWKPFALAAAFVHKKTYILLSQRSHCTYLVVKSMSDLMPNHHAYEETCIIVTYRHLFFLPNQWEVSFLPANEKRQKIREKSVFSVTEKKWRRK